MLFSTAEHLNKRKESDAIVLPFWQKLPKDKQGAKPAASLATLESVAQPALDSGDFEGSAGEILLLYVKEAKERRVLLVGLGKEEELSVEALRKAYSNVAKECQKKKITKINLVVPTVSELRTIGVEECLKGISEGLLLINYRWEKLASLDEETVLLKSVCLIGVLPKLLRNCERERTDRRRGLCGARSH